MGKFKAIDPVKWLNIPQGVNAPVRRDETIVVVGIGISAFAFVRSLHRLGYINVTLIARDDHYGGKCVNFGCMPSEYFTTHREESPTTVIAKGREFITSLRRATEQSFKELSYPLVRGEVTAVQGREVLLHTGETIGFDRLVLATGNRQPDWGLLEPICSLKEFWEIPSGKLVIVSDGNIASLTYASIAIDRGLSATVIFTSTPLLSHLPSFQYFRRELEKLGVLIISPAKIQGRDGDRLTLKTKGKTELIDFDYLMYDGVPELNLPPIDGTTQTILDLDLKRACLKGRSDLYVLGDASGFLSATEAELQAKQLAQGWATGSLIQIGAFDRLPVRVHARKSFAMVGAPWTLLYRHWESVDFKMLGWSAVHNEAGKLWYLYNPQEKKLEAIHLCHRDASELISLASVLIDLPVTDPRWLTSSIHPTPAEIFKLVIEAIEARGLDNEHEATLLGSAATRPETSPPFALLKLPPIAQFHRSDFYRDVFTSEERSLGILEPDPHLYFAILLGLKSLLGTANAQTPSIMLRRTENDRYSAKGIDFNYDVEPVSACVVLQIGEAKTTVYTGNLSSEIEP